MSNSPLRCSGTARVNEGSYILTCHPRVYLHVEWAILPLLPSRRASPHFGRYSFSVPPRIEGWVGNSLAWVAWSHRRSPIPVPTGSGALPLSQAANSRVRVRVNDWPMSTWCLLKTKLHYAIQLASWFEAGSKLVADRLEAVCNQLRTCLRPG